jgi:putative methyltransferase (TIGR04325 family)
MLAMAGSVSVIDLGGSSGWCLQASLGAGADVEKYVVVELPCVIEGMAHLATGVLSFQEWQEALLDESVYQVMYVNSVLQYLDNNDLLLTLVKAKAPHFVLLDELLWSPTTFDWYTIQRNLDSPAVVRFASEQKLTSALKELGYRCVWRRLSANAGEWHFPDMAEFGQDVAVDGRLSLLFINDG